MIRIGEGVPHLFELPKDEVLEVSMSHPEVDAVASLGLQWFAVPAVSDLALDMGGLVYPAAPSNGFYMSTEIGSFNLSDPQRYDLLGAIAEAIGLDTGLDNPLWRDRALVEINRMVLHSFREAGVRIMDHHALSEWFERFRADETEQGRPVYGHWPWIVPPMSANLSRVWHDVSLRKIILKPNYFYQKRRADILACLAQARGG
jgi:nitric-oxide synthase